MFGKPAAPEAGGIPATPETPTNRTMMFGGARDVKAAEPRIAERTTKFGLPVQTPAAAAIKDSPANRTAMFGAPAPAIAPLPAASAANRTVMMYGVGAVKNDQLPTQKIEESALGSQAGPLSEGPPRTSSRERTMRVDMDEVLKAQKTEKNRKAPAFGEAEPTILAGPALHAGNARGQDGSDASTAPPPDEEFSLEILASKRMSDRALPQPALAFSAEELSAPLDLPPEVPDMLQTSQVESDENSDLEAMRAIQLASSRRAKIAVTVILALAVLAGGAVLLKIILSSLQPEVPHAARESVSHALAQLRSDEPEAQKLATGALRGVVDANPKFAEARAALVLALAVRFDDNRSWSLRDASELKQAQETLAANPASDDAEDLQKKIEILTPEVEREGDEVSALQAALAGHLTALASIQKELPGDDAALAPVTNALAFGKAVQGDKSALTSVSADSWGQLSQPEYALAKGEELAEASIALHRLRSADNTFMRAYILLARVHLEKGESSEALGELETVLAMNAQHAGALRLKDAISK
jgi:hypothetical protein